MRVLPTTLHRALSHLYRVAIEPASSIVDELELENQWVLVTGLRRSDFRQIIDVMKHRGFVVEKMHHSVKWIEFTFEGIAHVNQPPQGGVLQALQDRITLKRASLRRMKLRKAIENAHRQRIEDTVNA
jgi:hypothetical protein